MDIKQKRKTILTFFRVVMLFLSFISVLCGGLIIGLCCESLSCAGGLRLDFSPIYSLFGLVLLVLGLWGLIAIIKKKKKILLRGIVVYGMILGIFCIYIKRSSETHIAANQYWEVGILPPNNFSVIIALFSVIGLMIYPFYKYEKDKEFEN